MSEIEIEKNKLINSEDSFEKILKSRNKIFVLFYSSWCPFSQRFLPIYEKHTQIQKDLCFRVIVDDKAGLTYKYAIDVVPTVLLFENGKVTKRCDGVHGMGLTEKQLTDLLSS